MTRVLGLFNAGAAMVLAARPAAMAWFRKSKKKPWQKAAVRAMRRFHPMLGGLLLVTGLLHGWLAWGWNFRHTGYVLYLALLAQTGLGLFLLGGKRWAKIPHRAISILAICFLGLHVFYRAALG